jgi:hypothetical protein
MDWNKDLATFLSLQNENDLTASGTGYFRKKKRTRMVQRPAGFQLSSESKKDEWAIFLCTDIEMCNAKILEAYALRWGDCFLQGN